MSSVFSIILLAGAFATGSPFREHRFETPIAPAQCLNRANKDCGEFSAPPAQLNSPIRDCPEGYSMGTVRSGVRYCVPDRTIRQ